MMLSDREIKKYLKTGKIKVIPRPDLKTQLGACSLDLRLSNVFRVFEYTHYPFIDTKQPSTTKVTKVIRIKKGEPFIIHPGEFALAQTLETIKIPDDLAGRLEGRSSLGRLGVVIHSTAALAHPGWEGQVTLELGNLGKMPVALYPGMRICAITFEQLTSRAETPYGKNKRAKYFGKNAFVESKIAEEK